MGDQSHSDDMIGGNSISSNINVGAIPTGQIRAYISEAKKILEEVHEGNVEAIRVDI